jgi:hypothetical protein
LKDAGEALGRLIDRLEGGKYRDRILGYHIAYGASGECVLWGRSSRKYGDHGISHKRAFYDWGIKKYGSLAALRDAWSRPELERDNVKLPTTKERYEETESVEKFFRGEYGQTIATDFDLFTSEINADAIEYFGRIVKDKTGGKLVGSFYGYFIHIDNPAYTGHLAIDRLLESPYVDFLAAPKSYYRNVAGEPGGVLTATQSINRKKIWLDELDNRTHLAGGVEANWVSKNMATTRTVFWREFAKNLADGSGFWWMDLGGGWFDSPEIMKEFSTLVNVGKRIRAEEHKSVSDVLVLIDDKCINRMNVSRELRLGFMEDFLCELHMTGCLADVYRLADFTELDLSGYKLIIFAYTFEIDDGMREFIKKIPADKTLMFNYAAGVVSNSRVSLENVTGLTGAAVEPLRDGEHTFPALKVSPSGDTEVIYSEGDAVLVCAVTRGNGGLNIINQKPFMKCEDLRAITDRAGCHAYTPSGNTVYGDNRFIGIFPSKAGVIELNLKNREEYIDLAGGIEYNSTDKISLTVNEETPLFFVKK